MSRTTKTTAELQNWTIEDELRFIRRLGEHGLSKKDPIPFLEGYVLGLPDRVQGFAPGTTLTEAEREVLLGACERRLAEHRRKSG